MLRALIRTTKPEFKNFTFDLADGGQVESNGFTRLHAAIRMVEAWLCATKMHEIPEGVDLSGLDASAEDVDETFFQGQHDRGDGFPRVAVLKNWNFDNANLEGISFGPYIALQNCSFRGAKLSQMEVWKGSFFGCDFSNAEIESVVMDGVRIIKCSFSGALVKNLKINQHYTPDREHQDPVKISTLENNNFSGAMFIDSEITALNISGNDMRGADIRGLEIARHEFSWPGLDAYRWDHRTKFPLLWPTVAFIPASILHRFLKTLKS